MILELGNGRGLGSGLSYNCVMESPDLEWHVAGLYRVTFRKTRDDQ